MSVFQFSIIMAVDPDGYKNFEVVGGQMSVFQFSIIRSVVMSLKIS